MNCKNLTDAGAVNSVKKNFASGLHIFEDTRLYEYNIIQSTNVKKKSHILSFYISLSKILFS